MNHLAAETQLAVSVADERESEACLTKEKARLAPPVGYNMRFHQVSNPEPLYYIEEGLCCPLVGNMPHCRVW